MSEKTCSEKCPKEITGQLYKIVMLRHGQSEWNAENIFTGWYDTGLTDNGREEARRAGAFLKTTRFICNLAFTSVLTRATETLDILLEELGQSPQIMKSWKLNERHYGNLTGLNKIETVKKYGEVQVNKWKSFSVPPPPMEKNHPYYDSIVKDPRYEDGPPLEEFPLFESLKVSVGRTLSYWNETIVPEIKNGKKVLIVAHKNSLRGIIKYLDDLPVEEILELDLPTALPFYYTLDKNMRPVPSGSLQFIGDPTMLARVKEGNGAQRNKS